MRKKRKEKAGNRRYSPDLKVVMHHLLEMTHKMGASAVITLSNGDYGESVVSADSRTMPAVDSSARRLAFRSDASEEEMIETILTARKLLLAMNATKAELEGLLCQVPGGLDLGTPPVYRHRGEALDPFEEDGVDISEISPDILNYLRRK